jgi:hypothetical protein
MINGFEEETAPLTADEEELVPVFVAGLSSKLGVINAISAANMSKALAMKGVKVEGPRVRKIINHIRLRGLVPRLVASSKGYYIATSGLDLGRYIESLKQREGAIRAIRIAMEKQAQL